MRLAAFAALVGRDTGFLAARLAHADQAVRAQGMKAVRRGLLPDDIVVAAFEDMRPWCAGSSSGPWSAAWPHRRRGGADRARRRAVG